MGSDDRFFPFRESPEDENPEEDHNPDAPASVVFMEMMRKAADRRPYHESQASANEDFQQFTPQNSDQQPYTEVLDQEEVEQHQAEKEVQRLKRLKRRRDRRRKETVGTVGGLVRSLIVVIISGGLIATILSWWTSPDALDAQLREQLSAANATEVPLVLPTLAATPNFLRRVGIVSGHRGPQNDPGAVCPDGLTENELNYAVAERVVLLLRGHGYTVDLLEEFDGRLTDYKAAAIVSLHSNDCTDYGPGGTGYLVSQAESRAEGGEDTRLRECIAQHYEFATGLPRHFGQTRDTLDYHIFREIDLSTPGMILEMGFMYADRDILVNDPDLLARGILNGILCFLEPATVPLFPQSPDEPSAVEATEEGV